MYQAVQANRQLTVVTPLGRDKLLLAGFTGREAISQLFKFELDLAAHNGTLVPFDKLLGQKISIEVSLPAGKKRFWHGIASRMGEGERDRDFTRFWVEMVPRFWLWTKRVQSRIFQHESVPEILKKVLDGLDVAFELHGAFHARDYTVQYRESDFDFASRLMEEEGIFYFFKHTAEGHQLVVANTSQSHPDVPERSRILFETVHGGTRPEDRISEWERIQELRAGKVTLWDHNFELAHKHLEAERSIRSDVPVGKALQRAKLPANEKLEIFEFPGEYAKRFDGVNAGGGDNAANLQRIFEDNQRTTEIRMQQEAVPGVIIQGSGTCRQLVSGHKFTLERHHNADGVYLLTSVDHTVELSNDFRSGDGGAGKVLNTFTCIPIGVPYRPQRKTPRPIIHGTQSAVVVGPAGQEIFTDKYGRVKVQFHWDRAEKKSADSSCWVRVGQLWAGKRWGASFWPRIGQEVIVAFENGDPDLPIIVGSVYNAEQMPPYLGEGPDPKHRNDNKVVGIKSCSTPGGNGFNELRFDDTKGEEQVFLHAQCQKDERVGGDSLESVGHDRHLIVHANQMERVVANKNLTVEGDHFEFIQGNMAHMVGVNQDLVVGGNKMETVDGFFGFHCYDHVLETIDSYKHVYIGGALEQYVTEQCALDADAIHIKARQAILIEATEAVALKVGGSRVIITKDGVDIVGGYVKLNCSSPDAEAPVSAPGSAADAAEADPAAPSEADGAKTGLPSAPDAKIAPSPKGNGNGKKESKPGKGGTKKHEKPAKPGDDPFVPPSGGIDPNDPVVPDEPQIHVPPSGGIDPNDPPAPPDKPVEPGPVPPVGGA